MSNNTKVVTGVVRLSYAHLLQPSSGPNGGAEKYSTTMLIPKTDTVTKAAIDAAMEVATQIGVSTRWFGQRPPHVANPLYDGDGVRPSDGVAFGPECKGHWVMASSSAKRPEVVGPDMQKIIATGDVYSGMYAHVSINFFPYANSGKKGIGCGLNNVMKVRDGEVLGGGRASAADDFAGMAQGGINPLTGQPM